MLSFSTPLRLCVSLLLLLLCHSPVFSARGTLTVTSIRAWDLKGDLIGLTEAYVKIWCSSQYYQTSIIQSNYPTWNTHFYLSNVDKNSALRIEVWDEDVFFDDLLGSCVSALRPGANKITCPAIRGGIELQYTLT